MFKNVNQLVTATARSFASLSHKPRIGYHVATPIIIKTGLVLEEFFIPEVRTVISNLFRSRQLGELALIEQLP